MVPKRQIQRKRKDSNSIVKETTEKLQVFFFCLLTSQTKSDKVILYPCSPVRPPVQVKDGPPAGTDVCNEPSANSALAAVVQHRPDVLLRQHSMPASLQTSGSDADSDRFSKGLTTDASQGNNIYICVHLS